MLPWDAGVERKMRFAVTQQYHRKTHSLPLTQGGVSVCGLWKSACGDRRCDYSYEHKGKMPGCPFYQG